MTIRSAFVGGHVEAPARVSNMAKQDASKTYVTPDEHQMDALREFIIGNLRVVTGQTGRPYVALATQEGALINEVEVGGLKGQVKCAWFGLQSVETLKATQTERAKAILSKLTPEERAALLAEELATQS